MNVDYLVIGGGIAGVSTAYELSRFSRVCVIEAEARIGVHATGRSAALFAPSYGGAAFRAITRASRAFFDSPPPGFAEHALLNPRGCLYVARTDQLAALTAMICEIRASGGTVDELDAPAALERVPKLRPSYVAGAAFDADATDIDVHGLLQGFYRGARARGTSFHYNAAGSEIACAREGFTVRLEGATVTAPALINAAGAWADQVAVACGVEPLGFSALRRTALLIEKPAGVDIARWPAVIDVEEQFYFKPDAGKLLLSPADESPDRPRDAYPEDLDVAVAVDRVQAALDIDVARVSHSWAGLRTFSKDRAPAIGYDARVPGFFWCAGQGGYGIQSAPAMARVVAALARGQKLPDDVAGEGLTAADLSPARFETAPAFRASLGFE
jgi:D-arginine dehydrogenase